MATGPIAGRLRRPGWKDPRLLGGIVLVAVAVAGVTAVVRGADTTTPYYAAAQALTPGQVISEDDLTVVRVRVPEGAYVAGPGGAADAGAEAPFGMVVTRTVDKGELLPVAALAEQDDFDGRPVAVRTTLPLAEGIGPGSVVDVYLTTRDDDERVTTRAVAQGLVVQSVDSDGGGFAGGVEETVYVVVPRGEIEDFLAALATDGDISVVGLAGGDE